MLSEAFFITSQGLKAPVSTHYLSRIIFKPPAGMIPAAASPSGSMIDPIHTRRI